MPRPLEIDVYAGRAGTAEQQREFRERVDWLCRHASGPEVLDMACGQGVRCVLLARAGLRATGVDPDPVSIRRAREQLGRETSAVRERVHVEHVQATTLPFGDRSFDTIILDDRVGHLLDAGPALTEAARLARDGACVLVSARLGTTRHDGHEDAFGLERLAEVLAPHIVPAHADLVGSHVIVAGTTGRCEVSEALRVLMPAADARLRALSSSVDATLGELVAVREELTKTRDRAEAERRRARRFKLAYERQRRHWSWRLAVALREATRSPRALLVLPVRILRILFGRRST